ncbi:hypothetical protein AC249_AIPGENE17209 [Exaiptasia diaphana]|nr:hypothetical protein AC249_AIPGENE17209 [Exaiptasia diaphana]
MHLPRSSKGGGVAIVYHNGYKTIQNDQRRFSSFEYLDLSLTSKSTSIRFVDIYRPPPGSNSSTATFISELSSLIEELIIFPGRFIIVGDFNLHVDVQDNGFALQFLDMLNDFGLKQHVVSPTHNRGHTLDLVITRITEEFVTGLNTTFSLPSDHAAVTFYYSIPRPPPTKIKVNHRKLQDIDIAALNKDILGLPIASSTSSDIDNLVSQYNLQLSSLLDSYAPASTRMVTLRPHAPWFNSMLRDEKKLKRKLERKWRSTGLEVHRQMFTNQCCKYQDLLKAAKECYYRTRINNCDDSDSRDDSTLATLSSTLPDYQIMHLPRSSKGGGVAIVYHNGYQTIQNDQCRFSSFEYLDLSLTSKSTSIRFVDIYRPPPGSNSSTATFISELSSLIEELIIFPGRFIIVGDFNLHVDVQDNGFALQFLDMLNDFGLKQHVVSPTHNRGHTLDLVITRITEEFVTGLNTTFSLPSDHAAVTFYYSIPCPTPTKIKVNHRKLQDIDIAAFNKDILGLPIASSTSSDIDNLVSQYNLKLSSLLDSYAPASTRLITLRPHAPWFNSTLRDEKKLKRKLERKWRSTGLEVHRQMFTNQCCKYQDLLKAAKECYYRTRINNCDGRKELIPNGNLKKQYRPYGVLNVQSFALDSSNRICQNPEDASNFEKYLAPAMSVC